MAGIYIHVPFCKKKCLYCDFYSVGASNKISQYPILIEKELSLRKLFIANEPIDTIYFGGGTPSLLTLNQIDKILNSIAAQFNISINSEITVEVNPDDVTRELLLGYRKAGVNRISIGVQSFSDSELIFLGRRHNALSAKKSIELALSNGFDNISIDLIYGIPDSSLKSWIFNLSTALSFDVKHLSCYHLTYENGTPLTRKLNGKRMQELDESISVKQFNHLQKFAKENGFIHYEVSNLAKEGYYSRHNTAYWTGSHYLGLGPSAHSYNGLLREWNPSSYTDWEIGIEMQKPVTQSEDIDKQKQFNEILLTHLRTIWGVDIQFLKDSFDENLIDALFKKIENHVKTKRLAIVNNHLVIPQEYFFTSDGIIGDLMIVDE